MGFSYEMRFDTVTLEMNELIRRVGAALEQAGIKFDGRLTPLVPGPGNAPTIDANHVSFDAKGELRVPGEVAVPDLNALPRLDGLWGVNLSCTSTFIASRLGRSTAMEVDFQVFHVENRWLTLTYTEDRAACDLRVEDEDAARDLYKCQELLVRSCGFSCSIYDEEDPDLPLIATVDEIRRRASTDCSCAMIASASLVPFERARKLARGRAAEVFLSTSGYVQFQYLAY